MRYLLIAVIFPSVLFGQSLSPDRVKRIKEATVQITIENSSWTGTGFFCDAKGTILTCWHVADSALTINNYSNRLVQTKRIFITYPNGEKTEYMVPVKIISRRHYQFAILNDFCPLVPKETLTKKITFLKLGNYNNANDGDAVYTCGYPLGYPHQFISMGIISTKFVDSSRCWIEGSDTVKLKIREALLDMTMNHGNSGGAIIRIGNTVDDDEVIGLADFIINPFTSQADGLVQFLRSRQGGVLLSGVDPIKTIADLTTFLNNVSIGVSGCVSIEYIESYLAGK